MSGTATKSIIYARLNMLKRTGIGEISLHHPSVSEKARAYPRLFDQERYFVRERPGSLVRWSLSVPVSDVERWLDAKHELLEDVDTLEERSEEATKRLYRPFWWPWFLPTLGWGLLAGQATASERLQEKWQQERQVQEKWKREKQARAERDHEKRERSARAAQKPRPPTDRPSSTYGGGGTATAGSGGFGYPGSSAGYSFGSW